MAMGRATKSLLLALIIGASITILFLLGTVLFCGLTKGTAWCRWWPHFPLARVIQIIQTSGFWGVGASIGVMVLHSFVPFPAELVAIANGMIFGPVLGTVITWSGAMLGAFLAFWLSRMLGRPFVFKMLSKKNAKRINEWEARYGTGTLLISRFIPVIAFNLINYVAGLTRVSWWTFAWTTGVGILPMTILMVVMGEEIGSSPRREVWLLLLAIVLGIWLLTHRLFRSSRRTPSKKEKPSTPSTSK